MPIRNGTRTHNKGLVLSMFFLCELLRKNQECCSLLCGSQFGGVLYAMMRKLLSIIISKIHLHFDWIEMD